MPTARKQSGWLVCKNVSRGMFSNEKTIVVERHNGREESYFVPSDKVRTEPKQVMVVYYHHGTITWATLPTTNATTIPVRRASIVA